MRRNRVLVLAGLAVAFFGARPVSANVGAPWVPGDAAGELSGAALMNVESEKLTFDLRPLDDPKGTAIVVAEYHIGNPGIAQTADLAFVAPAMSNARIELDGAEVLYQSAKDLPLPANWDPPPRSPGFGPDDTEGYPIAYPPELMRDGETKCDVVRFSAAFAPGKHVLSIRYQVTAAALDVGDLYNAYQIGYVLSPARSWASFGKLTVDVFAPAGWQVASSPQLQTTRESWVGEFQGLPADTLALTAKAPVSSAGQFVHTVLPYAGGLVSLLLAYLIGRLLAKSLLKKGGTGGSALVRRLIAGVSSAVLSVVVIFGAGAASNVLLVTHHMTRRALYGAAMWSFVLSFFVSLIAIVVVLLTAALLVRRENRKSSRPAGATSR